jgi:hypothetical protein
VPEGKVEVIAALEGVDRSEMVLAERRTHKPGDVVVVTG